MEGLDKKEVLDRLISLGIILPLRRFDQWRETGLFLPVGGRPGRGPAKGRAALRYPKTVVDQIAQIVGMREAGLDLKEIGWRLWIAGRDVKRDLWFDVFKKAAVEFDELIPKLRVAQDCDIDVSPIEELANELYHAKTSNRILKHIRKSLGPERFKKAISDFALLATGEFTSISTQQPSSQEYRADLRIMDLTLGLVQVNLKFVSMRLRVRACYQSSI